jgi:hypothetical protein
MLVKYLVYYFRMNSQKGVFDRELSWNIRWITMVATVSVCALAWPVFAHTIEQSWLLGPADSRIASSVYEGLLPSPGSQPNWFLSGKPTISACSPVRNALGTPVQPRFVWDCSLCSGHYQEYDPQSIFCKSWWDGGGTRHECYSTLRGGWGTSYQAGTKICYITPPDPCNTCRMDQYCTNWNP